MCQAKDGVGCEDGVAADAALQPGCSGDAWHPIETAPKMKGVLLFGRTPPTDDGFENWRMGSGYYHEAMSRWIWEGEQVLSHWITKPTHWQPLPLPPQVRGSDEERSDEVDAAG